MPRPAGVTTTTDLTREAELTDPPDDAPTDITRDAADQLASLAARLHTRGHAAPDVANFILRLALCLLIDPELPHSLPLSRRFASMFRPGRPGAELFLRARPLPLAPGELAELHTIAWQHVEPALLGSLFERSLDPRERHRRGAHYTDPAAILRILEPVLLAPLRRELARARAEVRTLLANRAPDPARPHRRFLARLRRVRVLDPACGAGNFLYLALHHLLDLEHTAITWAAEFLALPPTPPRLGPQLVRGIERDPRAAALARAVIALADLQWRRAHGLPPRPAGLGLAGSF